MMMVVVKERRSYTQRLQQEGKFTIKYLLQVRRISHRFSHHHREIPCFVLSGKLLIWSPLLLYAALICQFHFIMFFFLGKRKKKDRAPDGGKKVRHTALKVEWQLWWALSIGWPSHYLLCLPRHAEILGTVTAAERQDDQRKQWWQAKNSGGGKKRDLKRRAFSHTVRVFNQRKYVIIFKFILVPHLKP